MFVLHEQDCRRGSVFQERERPDRWGYLLP